MIVTPIGNYVMLKMKPPPTMAGDIVLPDFQSQSCPKLKPNIGEVVRLGLGQTLDGELIPFKVKIGDVVVVTNEHVNKIRLRIGQDNVVIYHADDILAIIDDKEEEDEISNTI